MANREFIREEIRKILFEEAEEETAPGRITRGRVGGGRVSAPIKSAEALANKDPEALMSKLNVSSAPGDTAIKKVFSVLKQAVETLKSTDGLETAYDSVSIGKAPDGTEYIRIAPNEISERNAVLYALHILTGAENAGILTDLDKEVVVGKSKTGEKAVVIFNDP